jgi:hypothetical protein
MNAHSIDDDEGPSSPSAISRRATSRQPRLWRSIRFDYSRWFAAILLTVVMHNNRWHISASALILCYYVALFRGTILGNRRKEWCVWHESIIVAGLRVPVQVIRFLRNTSITLSFKAGLEETKIHSVNSSSQRTTCGHPPASTSLFTCT